MSDVSEHDSDSDTEINRQKNKQAGGVQSTGNQQQHTITPPSRESESSNENVLEELKQQAAAAASSERKPEWQQYLEQNQQTGSYTYTDPNDGTVYEWDDVKRGWIPKIDDNFIAMYQANYGFTATGQPDPNVNVTNEALAEVKEPAVGTAGKKEKKEKTLASVEAGKKRKAEEKKEWFDVDPKKNNNVYVSNLPFSTTDEEFEELMSKYGIIMEDDNGKKKIKLYRTPEGEFKGDGRCCYLKNESVQLACQLLDDSDFKGARIKVELAVFQLKGNFDPNRKPKKKKKKNTKGKGQEKLLDWVDRPKKRSKFDRIVILKNMFNVKDFERDPSLISDLKNDLRSECSKHGDVKKVLVFDRNPEGVVSVLFHEAEMADECIQALNKRFYGGRTISASTYDGVTNYQVQETEEEEQKRRDDWERFIGCDDDDDDEEDNQNETKT